MVPLNDVVIQQYQEMKGEHVDSGFCRLGENAANNGSPDVSILALAFERCCQESCPTPYCRRRLLSSGHRA